MTPISLNVPSNATRSLYTQYRCFFVKKLLRIIKNYLSCMNAVNMFSFLVFIQKLGLLHYINLFCVSWRLYVCLSVLISSSNKKKTFSPFKFRIITSYVCDFFSTGKEEENNLENDHHMVSSMLFLPLLNWEINKDSSSAR